MKEGLPVRITSEQHFEAPRTDLVLPKRFVGRMPKKATTVSVKDVEHWMTQNTEAVTITDFTNGQEGQDLYILGDGFTTLTHGTNIFLIGTANLLLAVNKLVQLKGFKKIGDTRLRWFEV